MGAVVVELPCGACRSFVDKGVSRDGSLGAVNAQIMALRKEPAHADQQAAEPEPAPGNPTGARSFRGSSRIDR